MMKGTVRDEKMRLAIPAGLAMLGGQGGRGYVPRTGALGITVLKSCATDASRFCGITLSRRRGARHRSTPD